jgi:hypothetical protein
MAPVVPLVARTRAARPEPALTRAIYDALQSSPVNFGCRQLTVWWRIRAFWQYLRGDLSWGAMERRGVAARTA